MKERPKLSDAKTIAFRPGAMFSAKFNLVVQETGWRATDVARVGLMAFWPDIEALIRASGQRPPLDDAGVAQLRDYIELCRTAQARGIDPRATLVAALESHLATEKPAEVVPA